jgi:hypothetical protein
LTRLLDELGTDAKTLIAEIETHGHDRLCHLEDYLKGNLDIDRKLAAEMLARPRDADRKEVKSS